MPSSSALITVVCTANVCRSVLASELLGHALGGLDIDVAGAGTRAGGTLTACPLVTDRLTQAGWPAPAASGRPLTVELIGASDLILTLGTEQRGVVGRLVPAARARTFTLVEATALAEALHERWECPLTFLQWRDALAGLRGRVALPTSRLPRTGWRPRPAEYVPALDVPDGHTSQDEGQHRATLDQVSSLCQRFVDALLGCLSAPPSGPPQKVP